MAVVPQNVEGFKILFFFKDNNNNNMEGSDAKHLQVQMRRLRFAKL